MKKLTSTTSPEPNANIVLANTAFRPMLFSTPMVQAILGGYKNKTRRIVREPAQKWFNESFGDNEWSRGAVNMSKIQVGNIIWVRETFQITDFLHPTDDNYGYIYKASENGKEWERNSENWKWKPSLFMPKAACRLFLEVTDVRIERLQDISEEDAINEGVCRYKTSLNFCDYLSKASNESRFMFAVDSYKSLWEKINGKESWEVNPWVWIINFKRIEKPNGFL